jgi:putative membrane protein
MNCIARVVVTTTFLCSSGFLLAQAPMDPTLQQQQQTTHPGTNQGNNGMDAQNNGSSEPGETGQAMKDKLFLRQAAEGGMVQIKFGELAASKASDPDVKAFGQQMVTDHTNLNQSLQPFLDQDGVMVPRKLNKQQQAEFNKLSSLSGDAFDKEYLVAMVLDHRKDARAFRSESIATNDPDLRAALDKASLIIRQHLMAADKLAVAHGVAVPRPQRPMPPPPPAP